MSILFAYLDPGAGSILLQALVGGALAAAFVIKLYWRKLTKPFRKQSDEEADATEADNDEKAD